MLVTDQHNRRNRTQALAVSGIVTTLASIAGWFFLPALLTLSAAPLAYWLMRRKSLRRLSIMSKPFPASWEDTLQLHVAYFRGLSPPERDRFRQLVKVFLDEVQITGVRTDIDDTIRVLVAASAVIPIFGFLDWEYRRLREVLVYPEAFSEKYRTEGGADENLLGMVGMGYLRGVMILSKPDLLEGFNNPLSRDHVGIHEFTHLIEQGEIEHGLPPEVPRQAVEEWVQHVTKELTHAGDRRSDINPYAYTNEHEFFAVLAEYFFKSPARLREKHPELYALLCQMFHQDPATVLSPTHSPIGTSTSRDKL
jgi:Mlc titration factor MtfA (ptsG expression regulator)